MKKYIVTFFGIGLIPGMPGTYASLVAATLFAVLWSTLGAAAWIVIAALILLAAGVGFRLCRWAEDHFRRKDPGQFVLDEVAGQLLALLALFLLAMVLPPLARRPLAQVAAGFLLFRLFDVAKPWPIRTIERQPGAWGVLTDDLVAGVYAAGALVMMSYVVRMMVGVELWGA